MDRQKILNNISNEEDRILVSKLLDKIEQSNKRNSVEYTEFLNLSQRQLLEKILIKLKFNNYVATGGYNNWHWFNAVWDAGANAYRCDITPSTFNHYNQTYITHLYIYDHAGNGGYYNQTSIAIPSNTYTIFYDNNGGSGCSSQTATIGSSFGTLCTPVRDGYIFIGWFNANYKDAPLNYYSDLYADLKNAYGYDADKLYNHWVQYGAKEGRRISQYVSTDAASTNITLYAGWYKKPTPTTPSCEEKRECGCCGGRNQHNGYCIRYCCC